MGPEGRVRPLFVLDWNNIGVRVEEDGREVGIGAWPFKEDERLGLDELEGLGFEGERLGLRENELG